MNDLSDTVIEFDETYKKKKVRKGVKITLFLIILMCILGSIYVFFTSNHFKVKDIVVSGNYLTSEEEILNSFNIDIDDNFYISYFYEIEGNVNKIETVSQTIVTRENGVINIDVIEKNILFSTPSLTVIEGGIVLNETYDIASIYFDNFEEYLNKEMFIQEMDRIHSNSKESFNHISQISYDPTDVNPDRLAIYMRDTNLMYINDYELSYYISNYFNILDKLYSEIGVKYGELHFDVGSEFKPYE